jgi:tetratricopeptide (TPR) repeat protein
MLEDMPLRYDDMILFGFELEEAGKWDVAARMFRHIASLFGNKSFVTVREANALYQFGDYRQALEVIESMEQPTVASMIIEARCWRKLDKPEKACIIYEKAETILERKT